jgi:putative FmdB family regulatory protein
MPLYEYECEACRRRFEIIRKFSDPPVERCEVCGGAVRKLLSSPAIQFKGSGWYITDYARKSEGSSSPSSSASGDPGTKAEPKPAADDAKPKSSSD